jgi:hypothetical protein
LQVGDFDGGHGLILADEIESVCNGGK